MKRKLFDILNKAKPKIVVTDQCFSPGAFAKLGSKLQIEHERQIKKWGIQTRSIFEWLCYTTEELGELAEAIAEYVYRGGPQENIVNEAIQTATLCLKIAEMYLKDNQSNSKDRPNEAPKELLKDKELIE